MPCCFEPKTYIAACHDDCLPGELLVWFRQAPELVVEECDEKIATFTVSTRTGKASWGDLTDSSRAIMRVDSQMNGLLPDSAATSMALK